MYYKSGLGLEGLGPVQTDATLFATSSQHCWMLHVASVCAPCCMLLRKVWNWSNFSANNSQRFFCSMIAEAKRNNVGSVCTALPTLLGPCMLIMHGLQRLMGCILSTMHCRSQTCWELLHPSAHHCQHACNNSQHCWTNNVGSCCAPLNAALGIAQRCGKGGGHGAIKHNYWMYVIFSAFPFAH